MTACFTQVLSMAIF